MDARYYTHNSDERKHDNNKKYIKNCAEAERWNIALLNSVNVYELHFHKQLLSSMYSIALVLLVN